MAHKKGGRKRGKPLMVINVNEVITLGTALNNASVISLGGTFARDVFWISADLYWQLEGLTVGEGPIVVGLSHGDLSAAEISEKLDLTGMEDSGDQIAQERGRRKVRRSGQFSGAVAIETLNDGKEIRTRTKFTIQAFNAPGFWAQNKSGGTLTTGGVVKVNGKLYLKHL